MIHLILKKFGQKNVFFGDQKGDFTIKKPNFPENTLVYCNQGTISIAGDYAIYLNYVVLTQIIPANASPTDIDNYVLGENEVILNIPLYNTKTGPFRGFKKWLAFIMIEGIWMKCFFCMDTTKKNLKHCMQVLNINFQMYSKV